MHVCLLQFIWEKVAATFMKTCPRELLEALHLNLFNTRISINLINKGLPNHLDMVIPNQPDPYKCAAGISVSVHLGDPEDSVYLQFHHESICHELAPGKMAVFPGYALIHRTLRPIPPTPKRRYSVVLFFQFKRDCADKMDKYIRGSFPFIQTDEYRATV